MSPRNDNHPPKGSSITVEPIRSLEAISAIKDILHDKPRDLLLFVMATNNGIRCGDLLRLKVGDLRGKSIDDTIAVKESKTGKANVLAVNDSVHSALTRFLASGSFSDDEHLFRSQKGNNKPLTIQSVNRMVKTWCRDVKLEGNYGAYTLRKTFGYVQRVHFGVGFEVLCKRFNHASPAVTMRYLGISDTEVVSILKNSI